MGTPDVEVTVATRMAEAMRTWEELLKRIDKTVNRLDALGMQSKRTSTTAEGGFAQMATRLVGIASGAGLAMRGIRAISDAMRELNREADRAATSVEDSIALFLSQSGLRGRAASGVLQDVAARQARFGQKDFSLAIEAASQGVAPENIGAFTESYLRFAVAQGLEPSRETFKQFAGFIRGQDKGLTPEAAEEFAGTFFGAFQKQLIQPSDLGPLAQIAPSFADTGFTTAEQLAFGVAGLQAVGSPEETATILKNFVTKLQVAKKQKKSVRALKELGLTPDQVDFVGESLVEVLDTLGGALDKLPSSAAKAQALTDIFGLRESKKQEALLARRGAVRETLAGIEEGRKLFPESVDLVLSTESAKQRALQAQRALAGPAIGAPEIQTEVERMKTEEFVRGRGGAQVKVFETGLEFAPAPIRRSPLGREFAATAVEHMMDPAGFGRMGRGFGGLGDVFRGDETLSAGAIVGAIRESFDRVAQHMLDPFGLGRMGRALGGLLAGDEAPSAGAVAERGIAESVEKLTKAIEDNTAAQQQAGGDQGRPNVPAATGFRQN